ncbi:hypothetical protein DB30_00281 [Enhygromyxa salina]|uniref:Uncharacterized protein n=1 Tax=Enhygromyxa salina TaxID=215803 RepID=A0A0C2D604_9BACT|nr:hypothetical protein DB30_00281 [Enhygromyxa salina]
MAPAPEWSNWSGDLVHPRSSAGDDVDVDVSPSSALSFD